MPTLTEEDVERVVASWRGRAEPLDGMESPAGPLFVAGEYAEADLTDTGQGRPCGSASTRQSCYQESSVWLICC